MNQSAPSGTTPEVISTRRLYWVTIIAASMFGGPPPWTATGRILQLLAVIAWLVLVVALNIRAMRRSGIKRSGLIAPVLTLLFILAVAIDLRVLAAEIATAIESTHP